MAIFPKDKIIPIYFYLIFFKNLDFTVSQYNVNDLINEPILAANFTDTLDHIFPQNLRITVYLSRLNGLLFYSIDKNLNQMIVTIQDTKVSSIKIEFRNEKYILSLVELCNCKINCLYETLEFKFEIIDSINIQCNTGKINKHRFTNNKLPNEDYPFPTFYKTNITAFLWLTNIPNYENSHRIVYRNPEFVVGCIFNVTYNDKLIQLNGKFEKCVNQCQSNNCHGGECIETYNVKPICNCTEAFLNGEHCNKIITGQGKHIFQFEFQILKISLNCTSNKWTKEFLRLSSSSGKAIVISQPKPERLIISFYQSKSKSNSIPVEYQVEIPKVMNNINCTLLIELVNENLLVKVKYNNSWVESFFYIGSDFSGSIDSTEINCSIYDVAYKVSKNEIGWLPAKLERNLLSNKNVSEKQEKRCSQENNVNEESNKEDIIVIVIIILGVIIVVNFISTIIYWRKRKLK